MENGVLDVLEDNLDVVGVNCHREVMVQNPLGISVRE